MSDVIKNSKKNHTQPYKTAQKAEKMLLVAKEKEPIQQTVSSISTRSKFKYRFVRVHKAAKIKFVRSIRN